MLEIKNITKDYATGSETVHALQGVSVSFRESELVAVLGHSGCGKTTLLNIIGGLDHYTTGDLIINGKSTKEFKDRDWDTYRNHSIGFIFQSYNLIPHQTVLSNVELALTLSGVSKNERRQRAIEALEKVGLGDQLKKRPNQMSGGQMQRVAIARALVNDPDILLADEPTGALDSETSIQIMDLIKEIAKDRLVIMVTHNPDLARDYATRVIKLVDGKITSDSDPFDGKAEPKKKPAEKKEKGKRSSMSFGTALALSRNNLLTKKGRTFLTAFAGSIGIIGIALILSLSNGVQLYINNVERSTLASYPIVIQSETVDYSSIMQSMVGDMNEEYANREEDKIYTNNISTELVKVMLAERQMNNLADFKKYIDSNPDNIFNDIEEIKYSYSSALYVYGKDLHGDVIRVNPSTVMQAMLGNSMAEGLEQMMSSYSALQGSSDADVWVELINDKSTKENYKLLSGKYPENYNEVVLLVTEQNEVSDILLYALGMRDQQELTDMMAGVISGEGFDIDSGDMVFTYDDFVGMSFRLITISDLYEEDTINGGYKDMSKDADFMNGVYDAAPELTIVGVIRPDSDSILSSAGRGCIGYTHELTEYMIEYTNNSKLVKEQLAHPEIDVFTGIEFPEKDEKPAETVSEEEAMKMLLELLSEEQMNQISETVMASFTEEQLGEMITTLTATLTEEQLAQIAMLPPEQQGMAVFGMADPDTVTGMIFTMADRKTLAGAFMSVLTKEQMDKLTELTQGPESTEATYDGNLRKLGLADLAKPSSIAIYCTDFEGKERVTKFITDYNNARKAEGKEEDAINYTDYVGLMISSVSTIINAISYILIAFVAISLIVSSIMIGIITYISVLERTKEIGILRAIGASKGNISSVFNAETLIVGFSAGVIGIVVTLILIIPINIIIEHLTEIENLAALPWVGGVALVVISMLLTLVAGLFPASVAAKKDPVEALRTE